MTYERNGMAPGSDIDPTASLRETPREFRNINFRDPNPYRTMRDAEDAFIRGLKWAGWSAAAVIGVLAAFAVWKAIMRG